jgi:glycosyltransferase involved in cell wall biosynthesis
MKMISKYRYNTRDARTLLHNVIVLAPTPFFSSAGASIRILGETSALAKISSSVEVLTYKQGRDISDLVIRRIIFNPFQVGVGPSYHRVYLDFELMLLLARRLISIKKPVIIHAHHHEGGLIASKLRALKSFRLILDLQGSLTEELIVGGKIRKNSAKFNFFRKIERRTLETADHILVSNQQLQKIVTSSFGIPTEKVSFIPDGVDTNLFYPRERSMDILNRLRIPSDALILGYLGLVDEQQGVDIMIESFIELEKRNPSKNLQLLIMGGARTEDRLQSYIRKIKENGLESRIRITGTIDYLNAPDYLSLIDFGLAPKISTSESNQKILNYMAMGIPTVCFDTQPNRFFLGEDGIYAKETDVQSLIEVLDNTINTSITTEHKERLIQRSKLFSWEKTAQRIKTIYSKVS